MAKVYSIDGLIPVVHPAAFVHPDAVLIGDVVIGPDCYIGPNASIRGDFGRIVIGAGCNVQDCCVMHSFPGNECVIEDWGHVGHAAVLHGCRVGTNALVGMNACIMDGAVVGESSIVAAMAFVKAGTEIPARSLAAGSPARVLRQLSDDEIEWKRGGTREYQELARRCHASLRRVEPLAEPEPDRPRMPIAAYDPLHARKAKQGG
ncbi:MAG: phenylacetic acid degradation protein PaaY [Hyphomicrobiales bacterium]|nr:phenylacetic acid degradation protein PaaY [Hyphomicrobiales bacterium]